MLSLYTGITLSIETPRTDKVDIITTGGTFVVKTPKPLTQQELEGYIRTLISTPVTTVYEVDIKSERGNIRPLALVGTSVVGGRLRCNTSSKGLEVNVYDKSGAVLTGADKLAVFEAIMVNPLLYTQCEGYFARSNYPTDFKTYLNKNLHNMRRS